MSQSVKSIESLSALRSLINIYYIYAYLDRADNYVQESAKVAKEKEEVVLTCQRAKEL
jgi:hypothetical protein